MTHTKRCEAGCRDGTFVDVSFDGVMAHEAGLGRGWSFVARCDTCQRFEDDYHAALYLSRQLGVALQYFDMGGRTATAPTSPGLDLRVCINITPVGDCVEGTGEDQEVTA
jgi:hypothetical protein